MTRPKVYASFFKKRWKSHPERQWLVIIAHGVHSRTVLNLPISSMRWSFLKDNRFSKHVLMTWSHKRNWNPFLTIYLLHPEAYLPIGHIQFQKPKVYQNYFVWSFLSTLSFVDLLSPPFKSGTINSVWIFVLVVFSLIIYSF